METRPDRALGNSERLGNFGMLQALDGEEREHRTLVVGKILHGLSQALVRKGTPIDPGRHCFEGTGVDRLPSSPPRPLPETDVQGDAHDPGHQTPFAAIACKATVDQDEGILGDIGGLHGVPGEPEPECCDLLPMGSKKAVKRGFAISASEQSRDLSIFSRGSLGSHGYEECQGAENLQWKSQREQIGPAARYLEGLVQRPQKRLTQTRRKGAERRSSGARIARAFTQES